MPLGSLSNIHEARIRLAEGDELVLISWHHGSPVIQRDLENITIRAEEGENPVMRNKWLRLNKIS